MLLRARLAKGIGNAGNTGRYPMGENVKETLNDYIEDAHAMEENSLQMLNSMLQHTEDPEMREMLEHHAEETKQHKNRLKVKPESSGEGTSATKRGGALVSAMF